MGVILAFVILIAMAAGMGCWGYLAWFRPGRLIGIRRQRALINPLEKLFLNVISDDFYVLCTRLMTLTGEASILCFGTYLAGIALGMK
jgi:hypothetical protein